MEKERITQILQENLTNKEVENLLVQINQPSIDIEYNTVGFKKKRSFFDWLFRRKNNQIIVFSVLSLFEDFKISVKTLKMILRQLQNPNTVISSNS